MWSLRDETPTYVGSWTSTVRLPVAMTITIFRQIIWQTQCMRLKCHVCLSESENRNVFDCYEIEKDLGQDEEDGRVKIEVEEVKKVVVSMTMITTVMPTFF